MKARSRFAILPVVTAALTFALVSGPASAGNDQTHVAKSKRHSNRVQSSSTQSNNGMVDPSIGASCAYDRAAGACMIDLGNGRCMDCNAGPMK